MEIRHRSGIEESFTEIDWGEAGTLTQEELADLFRLAIYHTPKGMTGTDIKEVFRKVAKEQL